MARRSTELGCREDAVLVASVGSVVAVLVERHPERGDLQMAKRLLAEASEGLTAQASKIAASKATPADQTDAV